MILLRSTRRLLTVMMLALPALWLPLAAHAAADAEDARALIETVGDDVLAILENESFTDEEKFEELVDLLEGPIDLELVGRLILARHWRTASEEQRAEYLDLFRAYTLDSLASKLHLYQGQEFEITSARMVSERDALVTTRILSESRPPLQVDWRLRRTDGRLVAIDVIVENVSLIVTQRSEFGSVVERRGMDGLLAELRERVGAAPA